MNFLQPMNGMLISSIVIDNNAAIVNSHKRTMWTLVAINYDMSWEKAEDTYRSIVLKEKLDTSQAPQSIPASDRDNINQPPISQHHLEYTSLPAPPQRYHMNTNLASANLRNQSPKAPPPIRSLQPPPTRSVIQLPKPPSMSTTNPRTAHDATIYPQS